MPKYQVKSFLSKDTSMNLDIEAKNIIEAEGKIKEISKTYKFPLVLSSSKAFVKYENGEKTEWSVEPLADEPIG